MTGNTTFANEIETEHKTEVIQPTALESQTKAEFDVAVATAHRYPRSLTRFRTQALTMATIDAEVAASCYYRLSRQGRDGAKTIEGPSVRFAEIVANAYGNLKFGARIIEIGEKEVVAQGVCHDLEANVSTSTEVRRRITTKNGSRFGDDMIAVTCNAACSLALRNAIFKAVPFALAKPIYEQAKRVAVGDAKTLAERRSKCLAAFTAIGIEPKRIFAKLGIAGSDEITLAHVEDLIGTHTAIKDGELDPDTEFPEVKADKPKGGDDLAAKPGAQPATTAPQTANAQQPTTGGKA
ncbi:MAG: hypothetical protein KGN77_05115 [Xanthomonadaceae bacterium]|nr:hypothetical protein [Xanthomonadaceae bacterium]